MVKFAEELKGKCVKIVFNDGGDIRTMRGSVIDFSENFMKIRTLKNEFYFNLLQIIKFKIIDGVSDEKQKG